jgi:hypothetical protein
MDRAENKTWAERLDAAENGTQFGNVLMGLIATLADAKDKAKDDDDPA